jgi:hypothetical protein
MPADIYSGIKDALVDAFSVAGQQFMWNGNTYSCIVNAEQNALVTSKHLFATSGFPLQGDKIIVAGKNRQVEAIANSDAEYVAGGIAGERTFVDDPNNPSLIIVFNQFIGK